MTRFMLLLAAVSFVSAGCCSHPVAAAPTQGLRVMSFNIRNSRANDGINAWPNRRELYLKTIRDFDADLLGTQEVLADQYDALVAGLPEMQIVGIGRQGGRDGEFSALLFRKSRFELLDSGTFWLSETPEVVASKSWDAAITRICTWARLRDRASGREFLCANVHFDHVGEVARENSARLLSRKLPEFAKGSPIILIGDFNTTDDRAAHKALTAPDTQPRFTDSYRAIHPQRSPDEATFHAFTGRATGSRIDWILHTPELKTTEARIDRTPAIDGIYPSDHYPVTATLNWR